MPPKDSRKSSKTSRPEATASLPDFSPVEEEQQPLMANTEDALDPAFRQTIQEITANITRVIDEKLGPFSQTLQVHAQQLKKIEERTTEAEINNIEYFNLFWVFCFFFLWREGVFSSPFSFFLLS